VPEEQTKLLWFALGRERHSDAGGKRAGVAST